MSSNKPVEVQFNAEIKGLLEGLKSAEEHLGSATEAMRGDLGAMIESFEKFGIAALAVGAAGLAFEGLKEATAWIGEAIEHTNQLARSFEGLEFQTGASLHELNQYKVTMQMTGGSVDELQGWLMGLTRGVRTNSETFIANGIATSKAALEHMTFEEQLKGVLEVLEREENATRRNELAVAMLGRGGLAVVPQMRRFLETLEEGKKVNDELGDSITKNTITAMQDMEKATGRLDAAMDKAKSKAQETGAGFEIALKGAKVAFLEFVGALSDHENELGFAMGAAMGPEERLADIKWAPEPSAESGKKKGKTQTPDEIAAAKAAAEKEAEVQKSIQKMRDQDLQKAEAEATHDMLHALEQRAKDYEWFTKEVEKDEKEKNALLKLGAADQLNASKTVLEGQKEHLDQQVALGRITVQQEIAQRKQLLEQETALDVQALQRELMSNSLTLVQRTEIENKILALKRKSSLEMQKLDDQVALNWKSKMDSMTSGWTDTIAKMVNGQQGFLSGIKSMALEAGLAMEKMFIQMGVDAVKNYLISMLAAKPADTSKAAGAAAVYAVNAMASVAAIPGVGWAMAPGVGSEAYAAGMAMAGLASAAGGWDRVPSDQVAMIHKNEMVLSAPYAEGLRSIINNYHSGSAAPGGGGGNTVHIHATDAKSVQRLFAAHSGDLMKVMASAARRGRYA